MNITKKQLKRIIREEKARVLREFGPTAGVGDVKGILYDVLIPVLREEGITGPNIIRTLRAAADLMEDEMRQMLGPQ